MQNMFFFFMHPCKFPGTLPEAWGEFSCATTVSFEVEKWVQTSPLRQIIHDAC
jgi:hypothetical protein